MFIFFNTGGNGRNGTVTTSKSKFDEKIESSSAKMYFHYYGQLLHQQNMLQDYVRTGYTFLYHCGPHFVLNSTYICHLMTLIIVSRHLSCCCY